MKGSREIWMQVSARKRSAGGAVAEIVVAALGLIEQLPVETGVEPGAPLHYEDGGAIAVNLITGDFNATGSVPSLASRATAWWPLAIR